MEMEGSGNEGSHDWLADKFFVREKDGRALKGFGFIVVNEM